MQLAVGSTRLELERKHPRARRGRPRTVASAVNEAQLCRDVVARHTTERQQEPEATLRQLKRPSGQRRKSAETLTRDCERRELQVVATQAERNRGVWIARS